MSFKVNNKFIFIIIIYVIMFLVSIADNLRGPFTQYIKQDFIISDASIGILFLTCSFSYMIFTLIGGKLLYNISHKSLIILGLIISLFSILKIYLSANFFNLLTGLFLLNAGEGFLLVSFNTYVPTISSKYKGTIMNLLHIFYGVGAFTIQISSPFLVQHNITWRIVHVIIGICLVVCLLSLCSIHINKANYTNIKSSNLLIPKESINKYILVLYVLALSSYIAAESCTGNWLTTYLHDGLNISYESAAIYLSLFYIFITIGRLLGGYLADLFGYLRLSFISIFAGFISYIAGYIFFEKAIILICISGIFLSIYFPTMLLTLSKIFRNTSSQIISFIMSISSLLCMFLNYFIGKASTTLNIYIAFLFIPIALAVSAICSTLICYESFKLRNSNSSAIKNAA